MMEYGKQFLADGVASVAGIALNCGVSVLNTNTPTYLRRFGSLAVLGLAMLATVWPAPLAVAADPVFVGALADAVDDHVARDLGLTPDQKEKLLELIDAREQEALTPVMRLKDLPAAEGERLMASFRAESEKMGMALLTPEQQTQLRQIHLRRAGLTSLADDAVAGRLKLSDVQKQQVTALMREQDERLRELDPDAGHLVQQETIRKLYAVLDSQQQASWDAMTSRSGDGTPSAADEPLTAASPASDDPAASDSATTDPTQDPTTEDPVAADPDATTLVQGAVADPEQPPADLPPTVADTPPKRPGKIRFNFSYQPWDDVLEQFAEDAGLSLFFEDLPKGTCNCIDPNEYTPGEAIDRLNGLLLGKGYTLLRRGTTLFVLNLDDGIPDILVKTVSLEELDDRGEFELVRVVFDLDKFLPEEAEAEVGKLLGETGKVVSLPKSKQLLVTETAGRLRSIRKMIQRVEDPEGLEEGSLQAFKLENITFAEAMTIMRPLLDIPEETSISADGSLRVAQGRFGDTIYVTGTPEGLAAVKEVLDEIDVPLASGQTRPAALGDPQLEVYAVGLADLDTTQAIIETLLADSPDVRIAADAIAGNLVILAQPSEHQTVRATLEQLQGDAPLIEVLYLNTLDALSAVSAINIAFGGSEEEAGENAPQVSAGMMTGQLIVRGTQKQIDQVRELLDKMGESETDEDYASGGGTVRTLQMSSQSARSMVKRLQGIWPAIRPNELKVMETGPLIPSVRPSSLDGSTPVGSPLGPMGFPADLFLEGFPLDEPRQPPARPQRPVRPAPDQPQPNQPQPNPSQPKPGPAAAPPSSTKTTDRPTENRSAALPASNLFHFVSQTVVDDEAAAEAGPDAAEAAVASPPNPDALPEQPEVVPDETSKVDASQETASDPTTGEPDSPQKTEDIPPVIITVVPGGLMIACEDTEVLDDFEDLLYTLTGGDLFEMEPEWKIFYLKHSTASVVAQTLDAVLGGGTSTDSGGGGGGGGGGLMGGLASAAFGGGGGGGLLGSLLGMGGGGGGSSLSTSGSIQITADARLNALVVQAVPSDLDLIEELLKIFDREKSPEDIQVVPKAKMIRLVNTQAEEIATKIQDLYRDRMISSGGGQGGNRQPSPQEFLQALRGGGRGGRGGTSERGGEQPQKMAITVYERTNSILLSAPEPLFAQVEGLIAELDRAATEVDEDMVLYRVRDTSLETIQRALSAIMGSSVQFSGTSRQPAAGSRPAAGTPDAAAEARRAAFIQMMNRGRPGGGGAPVMQGGGAPRGGTGGRPTGGGAGGGRGGPGGGRGGR